MRVRRLQNGADDAVVREVEPLSVRVQLADSPQAETRAAVYLGRGGVPPSGVDRAEADYALRVSARRLYNVVVGFARQRRVRPSHAHRGGAADAVFVHRAEQVFGGRHARGGVGEHVGECGVARQPALAPRAQVGREQVDVVIGRQRLPRRHPPVYHQLGAGDVGGFVRRQKENPARYLHRLADAPHRDAVE